MQSPLNITFLWHMHQPYYKNVETNKFILPWVRLHGVKDYYDMVSILDKYPDIKQNFNLVPSLLLQIEEYISGTTDIFLDMSRKKAGDLNEDERVFVLFNFFMANWETMVYPYRRYSFLLKKRGENSHPDELKKTHMKFTEQEIRDLQVWFNLAWIDTDFLAIFPELKQIKEKEENYTEEEKNIVLSRHIDILKMIIPKYKEAQNRGQIEISTTPFYHPILPLVYDTKIAKTCMPELDLDVEFSKPEDAEAQVQMAVSYFKEKFGEIPFGMWPAEGSVSEDVINIFAKYNIKWIATDEEILFQSLMLSGTDVNGKKDTIYKPYVYKSKNGTINMFFRNHYLSDLIGFTYPSWNYKEAADHFIAELYKIKNSLPEGDYAANIILDGENSWESYTNDGKDFLNALYSKLAVNADFKTVTMKEAVEKIQAKPELTKVFPGSWIDHNFAIWIGHADDRKAWKLLKKTREDLDSWALANKNADNGTMKKAWEEIYIAEGSDWNWWYGDDHSSKNDAEFDNLYRLHLMNVYKMTGRDIPDDLFVPITKAGATFEIKPTRFIYPEIDGNRTHYYEWKGAGVYDLSKDGGAMHKAGKFFEYLYYGFNLENFYVRLDAADRIAASKEKLEIELKFIDGDRAGEIKFFIDKNGIEAKNMDAQTVKFAAADIFEARIPFAGMGELAAGNEIKFQVFIYKNGEIMERIPEKGVVAIQLPDEKFDMYNWRV